MGAVTEGMKTLVPALVLTLTFLCQGWGRHFLVHTKDSNLTDYFQYDEDYKSSCHAGCGGNYNCPRQCPQCRKGGYEAKRAFGSRVDGKRKKRAVNAVNINVIKRCYIYQHSATTTKKSSGTCFGPTNTVETKEGVKTIPELRIGDLIRTSSGNHHSDFTEFVGWLDRQKSSPSEMLQIFTSSNSPAVILSGSHLVFTGNTTKYAGDLVPGDTLLRWDGVQMEEQKISMIKTSVESGFWAPLTRSGTLLVNGFLMSSYASYPHTVSDIAMGPVKAMPMILLDDHESQHNDGLREVIRLMKGIGRFIGTRWEETSQKNLPINVASFSDLMKTEL